jgi:hypothetical protein
MLLLILSGKNGGTLSATPLNALDEVVAPDF